MKIGDTEKGGKYINQAREKIKPEGVSKSRLVHKGDFLLTNSMSFGRPYILNVDGCIHDGWLVLSDNFKAFDKDFLYYLLSSKFAYYQFCESVSGAVVKNLNSDKVAISRFAIPPINEQKRIANKIESLVPLIEKYEKFENELYELNSNIKGQLKKSILQYAIEGKLVPQDLNDEPATVLLERMHKEKEKLIADKKIKKDKNESMIYRRDNSYYEKCGSKILCIDEEIPFYIPDNWEWARLGNIGEWKAGATPSKSNMEYYKNGSIPWLLTGDLNDGIIQEIPNKITEKALNETSVKLNPSGSVLIAMYGATIGKLGILSFPATTNQACCACNVFQPFYNLYLFYFLMANKIHFVKQGEGGAQPNISREKIVKTLIPVPPINEQKRIINKIKKLKVLL
ncbi:MAG: restriction endonuclease subunit S [Holdemanella biformis]|nr:restriction endonuclease subunit S [Holdemanella biformis]